MQVLHLLLFLESFEHSRELLGPSQTLLISGEASVCDGHPIDNSQVTIYRLIDLFRGAGFDLLLAHATIAQLVGIATFTLLLLIRQSLQALDSVFLDQGKLLWLLILWRLESLGRMAQGLGGTTHVLVVHAEGSDVFDDEVLILPALVRCKSQLVAQMLLLILLLNYLAAAAVQPEKFVLDRTNLLYGTMLLARVLVGALVLNDLIE